MSATSRERISSGSVAIVTGAGRMRGIGRAVATRLADEGFAVVVHERSSDPAARTPLEAAARWCGAASVFDEIEALGGRCVAVAGDITDVSTTERSVDAAGELGSLVSLVNDHGSAGEANTHLAHETPEALWDDTFRVNVGSLRTITSVVVPVMSAGQAPERSIVHVSSTAGHRALPRYSAYCVSKAAVERLTEQQALELARFGIRVFLTGARSGYITGQILTVDGGMTLA